MASGSEKKLEKLDVKTLNSNETAAERLVKNMMGPSGAKPKTSKPPKIVPLGQSALLDRVKLFLPQMEEANLKLMEAEQPEDLDIEKISKKHKDNYIEFNLSCADLEDDRLGVLREIVGQNKSSDCESSSDEEEDKKSEPKVESKKKILITELT